MAAEPAPSQPAGTPESGGLRPMERRDLPAIGNLFRKVFRPGRKQAAPDLETYLETVFFGSPLYSPEKGSIVYDAGGQGITSALLAVPMEFEADGRRFVAKLLCAFMTEGKSNAIGVARLARHMRAARQDFCFSDTASPVSADHWAAGGGITLPIQSLEWRRVFRPAAAGALTWGRRLPALRSPAVLAPLGPVDRALRARRPSLRPSDLSGCRTMVASAAEILACVGPMTERFRVRPVWSGREFDWLLRTAALNRHLGELHFRTVLDARGTVIGAFLYFGLPGREATVLNVLSLPGHEMAVVDQMFATLDAEGYAAASGMAQPFLMNAICRQRWLSFRHRGYFCMATRHPEIADAAMRGDIYIGGLASESWSRLLTDF